MSPLLTVMFICCCTSTAITIGLTNVSRHLLDCAQIGGPYPVAQVLHLLHYVGSRMFLAVTYSRLRLG